MAVDLTAILSKPMDSIEPPKQLPVGQYLFTATKFEPGETSQKNPKVTVFCSAVSPIEADPEALAGIDFPKEMRQDFVLTEAAAYRLKDFLKVLGIDGDNLTLGEALAQLGGRAFRGNVIHRPSQNDPSKMYANISETFSAE